jgi:hypothetical protein
MFDFLNSLILALENFSLKLCIPNTPQTRLLYPFFPETFLDRKILIPQYQDEARIFAIWTSGMWTQNNTIDGARRKWAWGLF